MDNITFVSRYQGKSAAINGYLALPASGKPHGGVLIVHEIFGLDAHTKKVAERFARAGFIALAPDLFTREGAPPPLSGGDFKPLQQFASAIPDAQIMADLDAASAYVRKQGAAKTGIVGFCWGGRIAMLYAAHAKSLDAAVAFYGRISGASTANQPQHPLDVAAEMRVPLQGHFGAEDKSIPPTDAQKLRAALAEHGKTADIHIYENAGHAFTNDDRPDMYHPQAAELAFKRTMEWLEKYLKS